MGVGNYFKSKTVWFGLLVVILSWAQQAINQVGLSPDQISLVGSILGAIIVWLRTMTTNSINDK
jgi:hypothetical protein